MTTKANVSKVTSTAVPTTAPAVTTIATGSSLPTITTEPKGFSASIQQMLQGVQTVLPTGSSFSASSGGLTQAAMVSQLQAMLQAYQAVSNDAITLKETRAQLSAQVPTFHQQYTTMKNLLIGFFGAGSPQLAKFGIKSKSKAKPLTAEKLVERQAKAQQTRDIRGTLGSQQKKKKTFTGTISVSATPNAAASSPVSSETAGSQTASVPVSPLAPAPSAPVVSK